MLKAVKSTVKNSIIYGLGNVSSKLAGFILLPLYTEYLTVYDYGILSIVEITLQLLVSVIGLKIYTALLRWYWDKKYQGQQKTIFFTSSFFVLIISIVASAIGVFFSDPISSILFDDIKFSYLIQLMFISTGLQTNIVMVNSLMRIQEKPVIYSVSSMLKFIIIFLCTIYFLVYMGRGVDGIYEAQIIGQASFFLYMFSYILKNITLKLESSILKKMIYFSVPLIFAEIAGVVFAITARYGLKFLKTVEDVGIFSLGFKMANTISVFIVASIMLAITPLIYKKINDPDNKRFYSKIMTYFTFGIMFFVIALSIFGKETIKFLAHNRQFWEAYKIIPILSFSALFAMLKDVSLMGLLIKKNTKLIAGLVIIMAFINIILNIFLIHFFNFVGAAVASLIAQILFFMIVHSTAQKYYFIPYESSKIIKMIAVGLFIYIVSVFFDPFPLLYRLGIKFSLILLFPVILYFWNFFEEIELLRLRQFWNTWINKFGIGKNPD